jgi:Zn-dependent peptidase ImmA (M78 family)
MANRLRTTLTHELGHVHFHTFLFDAEQSGDLFAADQSAKSNKCHRITMLHASETDWMEWQAGYACGAFLMPANALRETVRSFLMKRSCNVARFGIHTADGQALIQSVAKLYEVSREAAAVRLSQQGNFVTAAAVGNLI